MTLKRANAVLVPNLEVAAGFWARTKGLIGRRDLPEDRGLLILRCNSIHTFFMKFAIDLVFVDRDMKVRKTYSSVPPRRLVLPVWGASSVIELRAGFLNNHPVNVGEQLHVDHPLS